MLAGGFLRRSILATESVGDFKPLFSDLQKCCILFSIHGACWRLRPLGFGFVGHAISHGHRPLTPPPTLAAGDFILDCFTSDSGSLQCKLFIPSHHGLSQCYAATASKLTRDDQLRPFRSIWFVSSMLIDKAILRPRDSDRSNFLVPIAPSDRRRGSRPFMAGR